MRSHGCASLAPASIDEAKRCYRITLRIDDRTAPVTLTQEDGALCIHSGVRLSKRDASSIKAQVASMFRLADDLSPFYRMIAEDPVLSWACVGAGRLLSSASAFEDVVKTICTTNCAWSATIRMTDALARLGGGAFPSPQSLASTGGSWFRDTARMGYRGPYIKTIAQSVASGELDLEALLSPHGLHDQEVEERLLALPGIGPYAAAHIMQMLGRHRRLILDSWTRPAYLRIAKKKTATDRTIVRNFAHYGEYAGLAFWLFLTRDWHD